MNGAELPLSCADVEAYLSACQDLEPWPEPCPPVAVLADLLTGMLPRPGSVVLLALPSGTPLLRYLFGALYAALVPVPVSPSMPAPRLLALAERIGAAALVAARANTSGTTDGRRLPGATVTLLPGTHVHHAAGEMILLTSGTSGIFSGCLHRVSSLFRNAARHARAVDLTSSDTILVTLPLHFSYALVAQAFAGMVVGAPLVVIGPPFSRRGYRETIRRFGVTSSSLTPYLVRQLRGTDLPSSLRMLTVGGDRLDPRHVAALLAGQPGLELYLTYGLTEAGPRVSTLAAHREPADRYGSVGRPLPGVRVARRDVRDGVGELLVTSDTVLVRRVGETDGRPDCFAAAGQIATGDLFRIDSDGYLYFAGRLTDAVTINGLKVSLASVRRVAANLPGVRHAATGICADGHGTPDEPRFRLDVYLDDTTPGARHRIERELHHRLLRAERPCHVRVLSADAAPHK